MGIFDECFSEYGRNFHRLLQTSRSSSRIFSISSLSPFYLLFSYPPFLILPPPPIFHPISVSYSFPHLHLFRYPLLFLASPNQVLTHSVAAVRLRGTFSHPSSSLLFISRTLLTSIFPHILSYPTFFHLSIFHRSLHLPFLHLSSSHSLRLSSIIFLASSPPLSLTSSLPLLLVDRRLSYFCTPLNRNLSNYNYIYPTI